MPVIRTRVGHTLNNTFSKTFYIVFDYFNTRIILENLHFNMNNFRKE